MINERVYQRTFKFVTEAQLCALLRKIKQRKYLFKEAWVESEEVTGDPAIIREVSSYASYKSYFSGVLYFTVKRKNK